MWTNIFKFEYNEIRGIKMAVKLVKFSTKNLPALRFIGKECKCSPKEFIAKWDEWLKNDWFTQLIKLGPADENGDMYLGLTDNNGCYWIGMLFQMNTPIPDGFEYIDIPAGKFAVSQFEGKNDKELLSEDGINLVIEEVSKHGLTPVSLWNGWCIERYNHSFISCKENKVLVECLYEIKP